MRFSLIALLLALLFALGFLFYSRPSPPSPEAVREKLLLGGSLRLPPGSLEMEGGEVVRDLEAVGRESRLRLRSPLLVLPGVSLRLRGTVLEGEGLPFLLHLASGARLEAEGVGFLCEGCQAVLAVREANLLLKGGRVDGGGRGSRVALLLEGRAEARLEGVEVRAGVEAALRASGPVRLEVVGGVLGPSGHAGLLLEGDGGSYRLEGVALRDNPTAGVVVLGKARGSLEGVTAEGGRYALLLVGEETPAPSLGAGNQFLTRKVVERISEGRR